MAFRTINKGASSLITHIQLGLDRLVSPEKRGEVYKFILSFAQESPIYFIFFALQILLASLPILLFTVFATTTLLFSLTAAIIFSFFWIGIALCVLLSTLMVTITIAVFLFSWIACSFLVGRWVYRNTSLQASNKPVKTMEKKGSRFTDLREDTKTTHGNGELSREEETTTQTGLCTEI